MNDRTDSDVFLFICMIERLLPELSVWPVAFVASEQILFPGGNPEEKELQEGCGSVGDS